MIQTDRNGRGVWYGKWRHGGRQVKRSLGVKRAVGGRDGLTRAMAEAELRRLIAEVQAPPAPAGERMIVDEVARLDRRSSARLGSSDEGAS